MPFSPTQQRDENRDQNEIILVTSPSKRRPYHLATMLVNQRFEFRACRYTVSVSNQLILLKCIQSINFIKIVLILLKLYIIINCLYLLALL